MMFSSPVSIRLSCSRLWPRPAAAKPTVVCRLVVVLGLVTAPIGEGQFQCNPSLVMLVSRPKTCSTPASLGLTRYQPVISQPTMATSTMSAMPRGEPKPPGTIPFIRSPPRRSMSSNLGGPPKGPPPRPPWLGPPPQGPRGFPPLPLPPEPPHGP